MKIPNWTKTNKNEWQHSSGEFRVGIFWERHSDMSCELFDSDWDVLAGLFYYSRPSTVANFKRRVYEVLRHFQDVEDLRLFKTMDEFFVNLVLEKCMDKGITVREYIKSDDAKSYDLFRGGQVE